MSEFGSSLQKKVAPPNLNRSTSQGDSSAVENKSSQEEGEMAETSAAATGQARKVFAYESTTLSLEQRGAECERLILAFFEESESNAKSINEQKDRLEKVLSEDSKDFFKNATASLAEYRVYLSGLKDSTAVPLLEEYIRADKEKQEIKTKMRGHVEEEEFEEAASCKKQIKSMEARQSEIEQLVLTAIKAGGPDAQEGDQPLPSAKEVLSATLAWEQ